MNETDKKLNEIELCISGLRQDIAKGMNPAMARGLMKHYAYMLYELSAQLDSNAAEENKRQDSVITNQAETDIPTPPVTETEPDKTEAVFIAPKPESAKKSTSNHSASAPADVTKTGNPAKESGDEDDLTLNERISRTKQPVLNYAEKSKETPIQDLTRAISISKKFEFINGLFDGDSDAYKKCLSSIQKQDTFQHAEQYLEDEVFPKFDWEENEKLAAEFFSLLRRRFMS